MHVLTSHQSSGDHIEVSFAIAVVALHGCPGFTYDYSPFSDFVTTCKTPIIVYNPLGNGRFAHFQLVILSDRPVRE
jgi:hypothetical protein